MVEVGYMSDGDSAWNHVAFQNVGTGGMSGEGIDMNQAASSGEGAGVMVEPGVTSDEDIGRNMSGEYNALNHAATAGVVIGCGDEDIGRSNSGEYNALDHAVTVGVVI
ncbi:MAG: hypothetical protein ACKPKO_10685, partial [Candidatus Fonsibacter sp.]